MKSIHAEAFMMIIKTDLSCGEDKGVPHVWLSSCIPPDDNAKCMCGKTTWIEDVERRRAGRK